MKVLLLTAYFKEEKRAIPTSYKLAQVLCEAGHQVVVLTSKQISPTTYKKHKNLKVYETKDIFFPDPLNLNIMPFLFSDLSKVIKLEKPEVCIISKYIFFPIIAVPYLKLKKLKTIVVTDTYPGIIWFTRSPFINLLSKIYYHLVGRTLLRMSDLVVLTHEELIEPTHALGIKHYKVIHNGIDLSRYQHHERKKTKELTIAFIGRLASIKGIDTLIKAARRIVEKHKDVRFVLAGEGKVRASHERIELLGYRKDIPAILSRSDILVMPSLSEGLPNAVMEAMASSLPVVASDIPGGMRVLVKNNSTGLTFRKGDDRDLEKKLERLINNPTLRKKLGNNARKLIEKEFNAKLMAREWTATLEEVAGR